MMLRWISMALLALGLNACGNQSREGQTPLSERSRDSVISRSTLPGAATVGKALEHSDDATQRAATLDSVTR